MTKKLVKALLATVTCATLVVGGTMSVHALAVTGKICDHEYYLLENSGGEYKILSNNQHVFNYWEEIFCMDCLRYITIRDSREESHIYNEDNYCDDCGMRNPYL